MINAHEAQSLLSGDGLVVGPDGDKIGKAGQVFLDDHSDEPAWVTVKTGLFGGAESFVPLQDARMVGDDLSVPYEKSKIKDAPRVEDSDGHLSVEEENDLYRYYDMDHTNGDHHRDHDGDRDRGQDRDRGRDLGAGGTDRSDARSDARGEGRRGTGSDADATMTRSEEQVNIDKQTESIGKVRLRKYVVTENVTKTVPVSHEEVRIEREPITEANRDQAETGTDIGEDVEEVELRGERVNVSKESVPVEQVHLGTETVTEDQQISEEVRKEQIETEEGAASERKPKGRQ